MLVNTPPPRRRRSRRTSHAHRQAAGRAHVLRARAARQRRHPARRTATSSADDDMFLVVQRRQPHRLRPARCSSTPTGQRRLGARCTRVPRPATVGSAASSRSTTAGGSSASRRSPLRPRSDLANAGMYAFDPTVLDLDPTAAPATSATHLLPRLVGRARWSAVGDSLPPSTSARPRRSSDAPRPNGAAGARRDHHPDTAARRSGRRRHRPAVYYREHGGRVLNAAIDKYVYVVVKQRFDDDIYVNYSRRRSSPGSRTSSTTWCARPCTWPASGGGVEITTLADIPSAGSGLGSSSVGHRRAAARPVRLPGPAAVRRGARRAGVHDRDRPLRQAHRQAGPVRRGVRRHLRHPLRARATGSSSTRSALTPQLHRRRSRTS